MCQVWDTIRGHEIKAVPINRKLLVTKKTSQNKSPLHAKWRSLGVLQCTYYVIFVLYSSHINKDRINRGNIFCKNENKSLYFVTFTYCKVSSSIELAVREVLASCTFYYMLGVILWLNYLLNSDIIVVAIP